MVDQLENVDDEAIWEEYERRTELLGEEIVRMMEREDLYAGEGTLDGREWCDENGVPESVFADAVETQSEVDWGISPMYPWLTPEEYR